MRNNFEKMGKNPMNDTPFNDNPFNDRKSVKRDRKQQRKAKAVKQSLFQ